MKMKRVTLFEIQGSATTIYVIRMRD